MASPINLVLKLAECSNNELITYNKTLWEGREVTFPYFADLPAEMQIGIGTYLDNSTRMSFYLTCATFYYTQERPRMLWREFAKASMLDGNADLVKFGLELGIELDDFRIHIEEAALLNHNHIFEIKEIKESSAKDIKGSEEITRWELHPFRSALVYAAENDRFDEYQWIAENFKISEVSKIFFYIAGHIRASNLIELKKIDQEHIAKCFLPRANPYIVDQALNYANAEVMNWLLEKDFFNTFSYTHSALCSRKDIEIFTKFHKATGWGLVSFINGAILHDNVELLEHILSLENLVFEMNHLMRALQSQSFHVFEWLLKHVKWNPHYSAMKIMYPDLSKFRGFQKDWLPSVVRELDRHELPYFLNNLPIHLFDANSFFKEATKAAKINYESIRWRLRCSRAPDNHQLIDLLFNHLDEMASSIITCPEASFSQIMRVVDSSWSTPEKLETLERPLVMNVEGSGRGFFEIQGFYAKINEISKRKKFLLEILDKKLKSLKDSTS